MKMNKTQKLVFENTENPALNVTMHLVRAKKMQGLPPFYQVLHVGNKIMLSPKKWDEWKQLQTKSAQLHWLHKNVRIYEPGQTHPDVDREMPWILQSAIVPV